MILAEIIESAVQEDSYDCLVNGEVVAVVKYDWSNDGATQPWLVQISGETVHTANTQNKAIGWVNWHVKNNTLPVVESAHVLAEVVQKECTVENVTSHKVKDATDVFVIVAPKNKTIGVLGYNTSGFWCVPFSSTSGTAIYCKTCKEAVELLVTTESVKHVYQIRIDGAYMTIYSEKHEFKTDAEAIDFARDLSRDWADAYEIRVSRESGKRWVFVL